MPPIIEERSAYLADAAATLATGERLAQGLVGGMVIALSGELGAGKTTLVRGMLRGLGWQGTVRSPTYTLVEHYSVSSLYFYHFDFYRFGDPGEWDDSGFSDYFSPGAICVIEWPERVAGRLPVTDLAISLEVCGAGRTLRLAAHTTEGRACLAAFTRNSS